MALEARIIRENYFRILEQIHQAAVRSGRDPSQIRLIVVTKGQPIESIRAVVEAGARTLGENYPEEALPKIEALRDYSLEWHMIGHLQSRKAKFVAQYFDWFQALDSLRLAQKLERVLSEQGRRLPVLLEFNVGGEESKSGWRAEDPDSWAELLPEIEQILVTCPHLIIQGIMTMPPLTEDADQARRYFAHSRRLRDFLARAFPGVSWNEISMGTSADFPLAIEEGATMVRIGQAILGPRPE
ncbi:YggS family pyridoxal phosphate-dependent enzyme [Thermanaerothrix sp.]|jgi:pyridoxal phosphate enzyme (YggS family)|uniref:YggS family pyridoxal phosphate-dependent enzyme n=1 Tax=Thermanaerothrix sp. TaxID=2972675 RepID=UPI002ADDA41B|nr:YggS family pyridoxal phosphate-dependent enzyme [Thermanaerothrix sp.]